MLGLTFVFGLANDNSNTKKDTSARISWLIALVFSVVFFGACAIRIVTWLISKLHIKKAVASSYNVLHISS